MAIRDSIDRVVAARSDSAMQMFEVEHHDFINNIVVPYSPLAGQTADLITTAIALDRGLTEANPFMKPIVKSLPLFAVLKLGLGLSMAMTIKKLQDDGRPKAAKIVSIVSTLAGAGPAVSNLIQMRR